MVTNTEEEDDSQEDTVNYKAKYRSFKRKLKFLIYENECFQETLRINQRKMLKVSRDKNFLLDRLLNYEKVEVTSSEGDDTESSEDEIGRADAKKRKIDMGLGGVVPLNSSSSSKPTPPAKKKKPPSRLKSSSHPQVEMDLDMQNFVKIETTSPQNLRVPKISPQVEPKKRSLQQSDPLPIEQLQSIQHPVSDMGSVVTSSDGMQRHLENRGRYANMDMDKTPSLPPEIFSNDPSLDSESNEIGEMETSPSNLGEDCLNAELILPD